MKALRVTKQAPATATPPVLDEVRKAMEEVVPRVCDLVASIERPAAPAIGVWSALETAVHLTQTMEADFAAVTQSVSGAGTALLEQGALRSLDELTQRMVRDDPERDQTVLARRMANAAEGLLGELARADNDREVAWVGGMQLSLSAIGAHVVEESLVHGRDIARSQRRQWAVPRSLATVAVGAFVLPIMEAMDVADAADADAAGFDAAFEFRIRRVGCIFFVFENGALRIERAFAGPIDVHVSAEPAVFLLVFLNRTSPVLSVLIGRMVVWGRRPWLLRRMAQLVKGP